MTRDELAALLEQSVLRPEATLDDVQRNAALVAGRGIGFLCVAPCWVASAREALAGTRGQVVAVIGFPHGADSTIAKVASARQACHDGAAELDMVQNLGALKSGWSAAVAQDIEAVVRAAQGALVKVILETAILSESEKRLACRLARESGAAFVKTSTGFHPAGGATAADVRVLRAEVGRALRVKASGGIRTLGDTLAMLAAGADRIGTSASAVILDEVG